MALSASLHEADMTGQGLQMITIDPLLQVRAQKGRVLDGTLHEKAKELAAALGLADEFKGSSGWLSNFKDRYRLKCYSLHGESGAAPASAVQLAQDAVPRVLQELGAKPDDVYNTDETGLNYRTQPNKTLNHDGVPRGLRKMKERITVLLCVNVTGTDKRKPLVIHKSLKPR